MSPILRIPLQLGVTVLALWLAYSVASSAEATISLGRESLIWIGLAAIFFSCVSLMLMGSMHQTLAGAIGTLVCAVLPGVILMRREPNRIV